MTYATEQAGRSTRKHRGNRTGRPQGTTSALVAMAAAVALMAAAPAMAAVSKESADLYGEARSYLEKGDVKSAIIQLKNAIRADPDNVQARFDLAIIYLRLREGPSAEKELKAARDRGFDNNKVLAPLARSYMLQGKNTEILDEFPTDGLSGEVKADVLAARGSAYVALKDMVKAEEALEAAVKEAPDSAYVLVAYGQVLQARGKFKEAEEQIDRALAVEPNNQLALIRKGGLLQTRKDLKGAIDAFSKAIDQRDGNNTPALLARAGAYVANAQPDLARSDIGTVLKDFPDNPIGRYLEATILAGERKYAEALDSLLPVMQALANYPPAHYLQASLDFAQGRIEQAQSGVQLYLSKVPDSERGQRLLAAIYLRKKDPQKAIELLEPMAAQRPEDTRLLSLLGTAYVAARRNEDATAVFEKVLSQDPNDSAIRTRLALSRLGSGDSETAVKEFESILENDPDETRASLLLVLTHMRDKDFDKALAATENLKKRMPDSPVPENFLGTIYVYKQDLTTARKHFEKALEIQKDFAPALLNLGEIDRKTGDMKAAKQRYEQILANDRNNLQVMMRMSQIAFAEQDEAAGIEWLEKGVRANPKAATPRLALVNALLQKKDEQRALAAARELVNIDEKNPDALDALARTQVAADRIPSAVSTYRQIIKLVPESAEAQLRFARVLIASKETGEAIGALERAVQLDHANVAAKEELVLTILKDKGADAALKRAGEIRSVSPDAGFGYMLEGNVLMSKGDFAAAEKAYRNAQQREPSGQMLARLYQSMSRGGKAAEGQKELQDWLQQHPDDSTTRFLLANALIRSGDYKGAIRENETLLQKFPENAVLLNDLAWLYGETGDSRAVDYAHRAHKLAPETPAIADTLGWLLVRNGNVQQGVGYLQKANEKAPNQFDIVYHYAAALSMSGDESQAIKLLKTILDTGKPFSEIEAARKLYVKLVSK